MITCIHSTAGLCPQCQADRDEDPDAWDEFGDHPAGHANLARMEAEFIRDMREMAELFRDQPLDVPE